MLVEVKTVTSIYLSVMRFLHVSQTSGCEIVSGFADSSAVQSQQGGKYAASFQCLCCSL